MCLTDRWQFYCRYRCTCLMVYISLIVLILQANGLECPFTFMHLSRQAWNSVGNLSNSSLQGVDKYSPSFFFISSLQVEAALGIQFSLPPFETLNSCLSINFSYGLPFLINKSFIFTNPFAWIAGNLYLISIQILRKKNNKERKHSTIACKPFSSNH